MAPPHGKSSLRGRKRYFLRSPIPREKRTLKSQDAERLTRTAEGMAGRPRPAIFNRNLSRHWTKACILAAGGLLYSRHG
jgi:hypothetical protein